MQDAEGQTVLGRLPRRLYACFIELIRLLPRTGACPGAGEGHRRPERCSDCCTDRETEGDGADSKAKACRAIRGHVCFKDPERMGVDGRR